MVRPLQRFLRLEAASGILLLAAAVASMIWANAAGAGYERIFSAPLAIGAADRAITFTIRELINDGLMTLFFFVVGMEIKRELLAGELRTFGRAALPAVAALGGMLAPAVIYLAFNRSAPARYGWGVPVATDIAFSLGVLTVLGRRVSRGLVIFITALAIFDDIGGILVIALFYGQQLHFVWMAAAVAIGAALFAAGRRSMGSAIFYAVGGAMLWYAVHRSGIHATISGVALGLAIPGQARQGPSPLTRFVERLHPPVAFGIVPIFALANSGVPLWAMGRADLAAGVTLGTAIGLLIGKQVGIFSFTVAAVRLGLAPSPGDASAGKLWGASVVGGIGFTVALFIAALAFAGHAHLLLQAKLGILAGSLASGLLGAAILRLTPVPFQDLPGSP